MGINISRDDGINGTGVDVELGPPWGSTKPGAKNGPHAQLNSSEGAFVEIDIPPNTVRTDYVTPDRVTARIPHDGPQLPIGGLNPEFVVVRPWWKFW